MTAKVLCILAICVMGVVSKEHQPGHSSQHIYKHDGHHEVVSIVKKDKHGHKTEHHYDYYTHPKYEFKYQVKDPHHHDHHGQHEHRVHDAVKGEYFLHDPDGTPRHVKYHADKHTGFHADVKYSTHHIIPKHHH